MSAATQPATSTTRSLLALFSDLVRSRPKPVVLLLVFTFVGSLRAGIYAASMGGIAQALIDREQGRVLWWLGMFAVASILEQVFWPIKAYLSSIVTDHAVHRIQRRVLERASSVPLVAFEQGPFFARL